MVLSPNLRTLGVMVPHPAAPLARFSKHHQRNMTHYLLGMHWIGMCFASMGSLRRPS